MEMDNEELRLPSWKRYEYDVMEEHRKRYGHMTYHWANIPEDLLFECGFINEINDTKSMRERRLADKKDGIINSVQEYGLDGIAYEENEESGSKKFYGIQCKNYAEGTYLRAKDIATFLSVTFLRLRSKCMDTTGYLYHSCRLESRLAKDLKCSGDLIVPIKYDGNLDKSNLMEQSVEECVEKEDEKLRYYQEDAVKALKEEWDGIGLLNLPCGTGKTTVVGHYLRDMVKEEKVERIFVFSPLRVLTKQNLDRIGKYIGDGFERVLVDGDEDGTRDTTGVLEKIAKGKVLISSTYYSAKDVIGAIFQDVGAGAGCEEDEEDDGEIEDNLSQEEEYVSNMYTENSIVIVDEAHNVDDELVSILKKFKRVLLLTATPTIHLYEKISCHTLYTYSLAQAIQDKYVCDYKIYLPHIDYDAIPVEFKEYDKEIVAKVMYLINGMLKNGSRRCIVYMPSVADCISFNKVFSKVMDEYHGLPYWVNHITTEVSSKKREKMLKEFDSNDNETDRLYVLSSVKILDEGIDIIKCDSVFMDGSIYTSDDVRHIQRMCRSNRLDVSNPNKVSISYLWCDELSSLISFMSGIKELDNEYDKKIKALNMGYEKNYEVKVTDDLGDLSKKITTYMRIRTVSVADRQMIQAKGIVERAKEREKNGLRLLPKMHRKHNIKDDDSRQQTRDSAVIFSWRKALGEKKTYILSDEVIKYMNENLPNWLQTINLDIGALNLAKEIYQRGCERRDKGLHFYPGKSIDAPKQEKADHDKLNYWYRMKVKGNYHTELINFLDKYIPEWDRTKDVDKLQYQRALEVVERAKFRSLKGLNFAPLKRRKKNLTSDEHIECMDNVRICEWRKSFLHLQKGIEFYYRGKIKVRYICPLNVQEILNEHFPRWNVENRDELDELDNMIALVDRCFKRKEIGGSLLPKFCRKVLPSQQNEEQRQESHDAYKIKFYNEKFARYKTGTLDTPYYQSVIDYLDSKIPEWKKSK
jgi:superfamily II DNA or RNA helicase